MVRERTCVVTGGGSGMGQAVCVLFTQKGVHVLCCDVNEEAIASTVKLCENNRGKCVGFRCNVTVEKEVESAVDMCCKVFNTGKIDIMIANAGVGGGVKLFHELTEEDYRQIYQVNVFGCFYCMKYAAKKMLEYKQNRSKNNNNNRDDGDDDDDSGVIIATASVAGMRALVDDQIRAGTHYSGGKAAVISMTQTIAHQLSGSGIRVNCVSPGLIETNMTNRHFERVKKKGTLPDMHQLIAMRRLGYPHEVAQAMWFIASEGSYLNATNVVVDGGMSGSHPTRRFTPQSLL